MEFFNDEVRQRIKQFDFVPLDGMTDDSDPLADVPKTHQPLGKPQAVPVPGSQVEGYSAVYRNVASGGKLRSGIHPSIRTFYDAFRTVATKKPDADCIGERRYDHAAKKWSDKYFWLSYSEVAHKRRDFAAGMVAAVDKAAGISPARGNNYIAGVYAPNSVNWIIADLACQTQALPSVCLYDTLGPGTSEYILNFCEVPVVVSSLANVPKLLRLASKLPHLKVIISTEPLREKDRFEPAGNSKEELLGAWAAEAGIALYDYDQIYALGAANPIADVPPSPKDIYAINFTSGTTGNPKGAIITHEAVIANTVFTRTAVNMGPDTGSTVFSFLPLAHIYERMSMCSCLAAGVRQAYPHGPVTEIMDDIAVLKPTNVNMVPRVLNRIAAMLRSATIEAPGVAGALSRRAFAAKLDHYRKTGSVNHALWDRLWSRKIRNKIGFANIRGINTGSAPLARDTIEFLKCALAVELCQGYGLTESLSGICIAQPGDTESGACGAIGLSCEVRLRDVPELGYSASDKPFPRGEIMLRGPQMFTGYYKNNEKTLEAIDPEGWFHTGDVGSIDDTGRIYIIDRVKNFFKLAQGEYVAAEKIENIYLSKSALINQIFVHGNSHETFLVAIAGVNPDAYAPFVSRLLRKKFSPTDHAALRATMRDPKIVKAFLDALHASLEPNQLQGFEKVKNAYIDIDPLTPENGGLTPTFKVKRPDAVKLYQADIERMYKEGPLTSSSKAKL